MAFQEGFQGVSGVTPVESRGRRGCKHLAHRARDDKMPMHERGVSCYPPVLQVLSLHSGLGKGRMKAFLILKYAKRLPVAGFLYGGGLHEGTGGKDGTKGGK